MYGLAENQLLQGKLKAAEQLFRRMLAIGEKWYGADYEDNGPLLSRLGRIYYESRDYADSETLLKQALPIIEKTFGTHHSHVGGTLNDLGLVYIAQDRYADAEPVLKRALEVNNVASGNASEGVISACENLSLVYCKLEQYDLAESFCQQWINLSSLIDVDAQGLLRLAKVYRATDRVDEAEKLELQAESISSEDSTE